MRIYIITGPIGSGKTEAQKILCKLDYECYCADEKVKEIYLRKQTISEMKKFFPEYVSENTINTRTIREHIFKDNEKRIALESYIQPKVFEDFKKIVENNTSKMIFFIFPIIQNNNLTKLYKTIYIDADEDIRLKRINKRELYNEKVSKEIIRLQNSFDKNKKNSDYYIKNNNSIIELEISIKELINKL